MKEKMYTKKNILLSLCIKIYILLLLILISHINGNKIGRKRKSISKNVEKFYIMNVTFAYVYGGKEYTSERISDKIFLKKIEKNNLNDFYEVNKNAYKFWINFTLNDAHSHFSRLAYYEGKPAGILLSQVLPGIDNSDELRLHVSMVIVHRNYRRRGVARSMLESVLKQAEENSFSESTLHVWERNIAIKLYKSCGYAPAKYLNNYYSVEEFNPPHAYLFIKKFKSNNKKNRNINCYIPENFSLQNNKQEYIEEIKDRKEKNLDNRVRSTLDMFNNFRPSDVMGKLVMINSVNDFVRNNDTFILFNNHSSYYVSTDENLQNKLNTLLIHKDQNVFSDKYGITQL